ncbi:MAG: cellulase family glycosylhydrolase [Moorea sp. SIO2B7]|nr:cellulase family glycosylhydrolase [Moorena sp. SIO2B7]
MFEWLRLKIFLRKPTYKGKGLLKHHWRAFYKRRVRKKFLSWQWFCMVLVVFFLTVYGHPHQSGSQANTKMSIKPPLSTRGSQIVDATNRPVILKGVNWFGLETESHAPHGLWARDYKEILTQIKSLGYNVIRLPYSVQSLRSTSISGIDFSIGSNKDLEGKTPLEVMDIVITEAQRQGLMILLDSHRLNDQRIPELWYGDGFTEKDWLNTWKMLAIRYKNRRNVIGADLKNEPHGRASWGTGGIKTDWRLAAERAGNAILAINPNWLIVVEGVEKNVPFQKLEFHWMGGNLEGVKRYPVRLLLPNKVVYSPHEYGPGVADQPWFSEPTFPKNLYRRWQIGFNYIAEEEIAPIFIGEFGGRQVDKMSKEGIWQRQLIDFIAQKRLSFAYWSLNPNSIDTGGILEDDWVTVNTPKQQLLNKLLSHSPVSVTPPGNTIPDLSPRRDPTPTYPTPTSPVNNQSQLMVETKLQSDWQTGFCVNLRVTNLSNTSTRDWRLKFEMNQAAINNSWNGYFTSQGSQYVVIPLDWARIIEPNQSRNLGFCANKLGSDYQPGEVSAYGL